MSSFCKCKSYSHFFSKNIRVYAISNDRSFNDTLPNDIVSFEQLGPDIQDDTNLCLLHMGHVKQKSAFEHVQTAQVRIVLHMCKVSFRPLFFILQ